MNIKEAKKVKAYFIIINLVLATVAFAYIIGSVELVSGFGEATIPIGGIKATPSGSDTLFSDWFTKSPSGSNSYEQISKILGTNSKPTTVPGPAGGGAKVLAPGGNIGGTLDKLAVGTKGTLMQGGKPIAGQIIQDAEGNMRFLADGTSKAVEFKATDFTAVNSGCHGFFCFITDALSGQLINNLMIASLIGAGGALIGSFLGGNGAISGFLSGFGGTMAYYIMKDVSFKTYGPLSKFVQGTFGKLGLGPLPFGVIIGAAIFVLMYEKTKQEVVEFNCNPWEAPIGGADCELCNDNEFVECSEYRCKSLGQACELIPENVGSKEEACVWKNPYDVNSPMIKIGGVLEGYKWKPDSAVRPPATGVVIEKQAGGCVEAFTPLEFTFLTDEPAQCRIDYNLTRGDTAAKISAYDQMNYYVGGTNLYSYNHTEKMSLPGPAALNAIAPELKNDGTYTLYVRCRDANGNFNQDAFSVRFCVDPGPDTTPPKIEAVSIPSNSPIQFNKSSVDIEVYVNEPAECKWSRENRDYNNMENNMSCSTNVWEMNNNNVYTCAVKLTGLESRKNNDYYFRCKDKPWEKEANRNVNTQGYKYTLIGTQPLNIMDVAPNGTIKGSTDTVPIYLTVKTDNGYNNGDSVCYYSTTGNEKDYLQFLETGTNEHKQRQDLTSNSYTYYFKCIDLGGNTAYNQTKFTVEVDKSAPEIVRMYKESAALKIIAQEKSICSYSLKDCNFNIEDGIAMPYDNEKMHSAEWKANQKYYIRCKDEYDNQPNPNTCSAIIRLYETPEGEGEVIEL
jgi:hypothetical protein